MAIDVNKIKKLREKTGAGIADVRQALDQANGDLAAAEKWLVEQGFLKAAKKENRKTSQGIVESYIHGGGKIGVLVEIACETDFVARTQDFKNLAHEIAMQVSAMNPKTTDELINQPYIRDPQTTIKDLVKGVIAKLGENIKVKRFARLALGE